MHICWYIDCNFMCKLEIKSIAYSEALQYRQDLLPREHISLPIHIVQKITILCAQKSVKSAF